MRKRHYNDTESDGDLTRFKKWLRILYNNYIFQYHEVSTDNRRKGHNDKTLKQLGRNLRLLRNNSKGIANQIFKSVLQILKSNSFKYEDESYIYLKLTNLNPSSNYYIGFYSGYHDSLNFFMDYMYQKKSKTKTILSLNESLLPFLT